MSDPVGNPAKERTCTTCEYCLREDSGYSNWTVMETTLSCLRGLNPGLNHEEPYGEVTPELAALLDVAKSCAEYRQGSPAWLDVDREQIPYDAPVTLEMMRQYASEAAAPYLLAYLKGSR